MAQEHPPGPCDLCGSEADPAFEYVSFLTCSSRMCGDADHRTMYHQECLTKYIKKEGLPRDRMAGFKCPRGTGKGTRFTELCTGRINSTHQMIPNNKAKKPPPPPPQPAQKAQQAAKPKQLAAAAKVVVQVPAKRPAPPQVQAVRPAPAAAAQKELQNTIRSQVEKLRQQIKAGDTVADRLYGGTPNQTVPGAPDKINVVPKGKQISRPLPQPEQTEIPGAVWAPAPTPKQNSVFKLNDSEFPSIGNKPPGVREQAGGKPASHTKPAAPKSTLHTSGSSNGLQQLPTLNSGGAGFVTDLGMYNRLLGLAGSESDEEEELDKPPSPPSPSSSSLMDYPASSSTGNSPRDEVEDNSDSIDITRAGSADGLFDAATLEYLKQLMPEGYDMDAFLREAAELPDDQVAAWIDNLCAAMSKAEEDTQQQQSWQDDYDIAEQQRLLEQAQQEHQQKQATAAAMSTVPSSGALHHIPAAPVTSLPFVTTAPGVNAMYPLGATMYYGAAVPTAAMFGTAMPGAAALHSQHMAQVSMAMAMQPGVMLPPTMDVAFAAKAAAMAVPVAAAVPVYAVSDVSAGVDEGDDDDDVDVSDLLDMLKV